MVARVIAGEKPGAMPTYFATAPAEKSLVLNLDVAAKLGISPTADLVSKATVIVRNGAVERRKK